jgi:hypothetical protein
VSTTYGIRDDFYNFWFEETGRKKFCTNKNQSSNVYKSQNKAIDKCLELLDKSDEYSFIREMFLYEYEKCMNSINQSIYVNNNTSLKTLFNTFCLDVLIVRRMIIEYNVCCVNNEITLANSTICSIMKNFDRKFLDYDIDDLIEYAKKHAPVESSTTTNTSVVTSSGRALNFESMFYFKLFKYSLENIKYCIKFLRLLIFAAIL